jgi:carnitine-CoA ligase
MNYQQLSLPALIYQRYQDSPDRVFLRDVDGYSETFSEFYAGVERWAGILRELGAEEGDKVAVLMMPSTSAHHIWVASAWLKLWEVPINMEFKGRILDHLLSDSGAKYLILNKSFLANLQHCNPEILAGLTVVVTDGDAETKALPACQRVVGCDELPASSFRLSEPADIGPDSVATVVYTSGTTGPSKGCVVPWGEFTWGIDIFQLEGDGNDIQYCPYPINHLSGKCPIYNMAYLRGEAVLRKRFSTSEFWKDIREFNCTTTILLGGTANFLYNQPASPDDARHSLKAILMAPTIKEYQAFSARFATRVIAGYGMTEIGWPFRTHGQSTPNAETCGSLRQYWEVKIVDAAGNALPSNNVGELLVRCSKPDSMMKYYLNREEATKQAWDGGWFHTGDAFRCDESGNYYFVDRIKDALRRRGENISSFEVEGYLNEHPAVLDSAVVAVPAETGEDEIKAFVVLDKTASLDFSEFTEFLQQRMPKFMVPRFYEFVSELPRTPTNKVRKVDLRALGLNNVTLELGVSHQTIISGEIIHHEELS